MAQPRIELGRRPRQGRGLPLAYWANSGNEQIALFNVYHIVKESQYPLKQFQFLYL